MQGLFRESGSGAEIEKKKVLVDLGNELVLPASENDHNVTGLLKMWIRYCTPNIVPQQFGQRVNISIFQGPSRSLAYV